jgi:hypothetical protein
MLSQIWYRRCEVRHCRFAPPLLQSLIHDHELLTCNNKLLSMFLSSDEAHRIRLYHPNLDVQIVTIPSTIQKLALRQCCDGDKESP